MQTIYHRRVLRITAEQSPNVLRALRQIDAGQEPDNKIVIPNLLTWEEYCNRRKLWDAKKQCVGLDAQFYRGPELLLFPPEWLAKCMESARLLVGKNRICKGIGVDPAEGGDFTSMAAVDEYGLIKLKRRKTPNTSDIPREIKAFAAEMGITPDSAHLIYLDKGGGGKEHADRMIEEGWPVRTVAFGERIGLEPRYGRRLVPEMREIRDEKYVYLNRRAEMYGSLSLDCDPDPNLKRPPFAIPAEYNNLLFELSKMPKKYDAEGRLYMLPKHRPDANEPKDVGRMKVKTLVELIGHSPDDADALCIANFARRAKPPLVIGAAI